MKERYSEKGFGLKDNQHASEVRSLPSDAEKEQNKGLKEKSDGLRGYPTQAFGYKY